MACYSAKNSGRNRARIFTHRASRDVLKQKESGLLISIKNALQKNEIEISLQPIVSTRENDRQHKFEVLLSIEDAENGRLAAQEIMPIAEKNQLSTRIDKLVLTQTVQYIERFIGMGVDIHLSVNLSGYSLADAGFRAWMQKTLETSCIDAKHLGFEFAESSAIDNLDQLAVFATKLRERGYKIALDDFGNQCSSIDFIRRIPLDYLKIDGHVISELTRNATSRVMLTTFIKLSNDLGIKTIAEFVEDRETESLLLRAGIDYVQGFGIGKPRAVAHWLDVFATAEDSDRRTVPMRRAS